MKKLCMAALAASGVGSILPAMADEALKNGAARLNPAALQLQDKFDHTGAEVHSL